MGQVRVSIRCSLLVVLGGLSLCGCISNEFFGYDVAKGTHYRGGIERGNGSVFILSAAGDEGAEISGTLDENTHQCQFQTKDGRKFSGTWEGKATESGPGFARDGSGNGFHFALGNAWYGYAYLEQVERRTSAGSSRLYPSSGSLPVDWNTYSGPARSTAESLYRDWSRGMGREIAKQILDEKTPAFLAVSNARSRMRAVESRLRGAMVLEGYAPELVGLFLDSEKRKMEGIAEDLALRH